MSNKNYTLVIDLTNKGSEVAGLVIGAAQACEVPHEWPNDSLLCAIDASVGSHRAFDALMRECGLVTHVRK